jgi:CRP/FNR family transcriptional regulator, cyclic AMP receptor protein
MPSLEKRLSKHPFLRGIPTDDIRLLAEDATPMVFQPGEMLFRQGKKADYIFLIEKGTVILGLLKSGANGPVTITTIGKGGSLGWSWAFEPYRWKFDAKAKTRVEVLALEGKPVLAKMGQHPLLGYEMMSHLALSLSKGLEATRHQLIKVYHQKANKTQFVYFPQPIF